MLTQCPGCQTVFRITGTILRAAHGQVRCGRCNTQFDAIEHLQEEEQSAAASSPGASGEQVTAEFVPTPFDPDAVQHEEITLEGNRIEISGVYRSHPPMNEEPAAEHTHTVIEEFNIDAEEWQNPFVKPAEEISPDEAASAAALSEALASLEPEDEAVPQPISVNTNSDEEIEVQFEPKAESLALHDEIADEATSLTETAAPVTYAAVPTIPTIATKPAETIEYASAPEPIPSTPQTFTDFIDKEPKPRRWPWAVASIVLILLLAAQALHHYRQSLVRHPTFGPQLARIYALFGQTLEPRWELGAYGIKQWGIVSDPQAPGTLRVRASITNNADFAQPYPLLKLTLEDRFGANLGTREFQPDEYSPSAATATRRLTAGAAANVDLAIVDPGEEAVGFQFDVCLINGAMHCAHDISGS